MRADDERSSLARSGFLKGSVAMKLSDDEVRGIASEARLSLTDKELTGAVDYINNFLDMLDRFRELDLKAVRPFCFAEACQCPLREDEPQMFCATGAILAERPDRAGSFFKVPRIMEE